MSQDGNGNSTSPDGDETTTRGLPALVYKGEVIHERHEMLSLTDMWKAAGSPTDKRPAEWKRYEGASFVAFLADTLNMGMAHIWKAERGAKGATFGHWQIAMAYAKYLDHDFHMWCNEVVRERMVGRAAASSVIDDLGPQARKVLGGIVKSVVPGLIAEALTVLLPALVREKVGEGRHAVVDGVSAGQVIEMAGVAKHNRLRGLPSWVTHRLRRFHERRGVAVKLASLGSRTALVYDPLLCREWLAAGGKAEIEKKVAERRGQGSLRLV